MRELEWHDQHHLVVGDVHFHVDFPLGDVPGGRLRIMKRAEMLLPYVDLVQSFRPQRIVELGIRHGGSTALLDQLAEPEVLVALELASSGPDLDRYVAEHRAAGRVRAHYGVDQADRERVAAIVAEEFAGSPLDLVVDDASHLYGPTRSSFETLFPLLRPGGKYVIEDWSAHYRQHEVVADGWDQLSPEEVERLVPLVIAQVRGEREPPLHRLVLELVLARASAGDVFSDLVVGEYWAVVTRGTDPVDPSDFHLADLAPDHGDVFGDHFRRFIGVVAEDLGILGPDTGVSP
jgi:SAM-dependent methyltransferase